MWLGDSGRRHRWRCRRRARRRGACIDGRRQYADRRSGSGGGDPGRHRLRMGLQSVVQRSAHRGRDWPPGAARAEAFADTLDDHASSITALTRFLADIRNLEITSPAARKVLDDAWDKGSRLLTSSVLARLETAAVPGDRPLLAARVVKLLVGHAEQGLPSFSVRAEALIEDIHPEETLAAELRRLAAMSRQAPAARTSPYVQRLLQLRGILLGVGHSGPDVRAFLCECSWLLAKHGLQLALAAKVNKSLGAGGSGLAAAGDAEATAQLLGRHATLEIGRSLVTDFEAAYASACDSKRALVASMRKRQEIVRTIYATEVQALPESFRAHIEELDNRIANELVGHVCWRGVRTMPFS